MRICQLLMAPEPKAARLLLLDGENQVLKALLPPPASPSAAPRLCESLALWLGLRLRVVLSADEWADISGFGMDDGFGVGHHAEQYDSVVELRGRRPYGQRLRGFGSFAGLLRLRGCR
jgi:hypothetical protein